MAAPACAIAFLLTVIPDGLFSGWSGFLQFMAAGTAATVCRLVRSELVPAGTGPMIPAELTECLVRPAAYGFVAWAMVGKLLPWTYTEVFGVRYERQVAAVVEDHPGYPMRGRRKKLYKALLAGTYPRFLCGSGLSFVAYPKATVEIKFQGRQSILGAIVDEMEVTGGGCPTIPRGPGWRVRSITKARPVT